MTDASFQSVDDFMRGVAAQMDALDSGAQRHREASSREATAREAVERDYATLMLMAAEVLKREGVPTVLEWVAVPRDPSLSWQHSHTSPPPKKQVAVWRLGGGYGSWGALLKPDGTPIGSTSDLHHDADGVLTWSYNDGDRSHSAVLANAVQRATAQLIRNHRGAI